MYVVSTYPEYNLIGHKDLNADLHINILVEYGSQKRCSRFVSEVLLEQRTSETGYITRHTQT